MLNKKRMRELTKGTPAGSLRILVFGAGAIGTYVGGSLALKQHPVTFIERPEVAQQIRSRGLTLNLMGIEQHVPDPTLAASLDEALHQGPFDVAIFALKSYDTASALQELAPHAASLPPILCLQNGVENESALEAALGPGKVIPGTVTSAISRRTAGDILLERLRGIGVADGHPLSGRLVQIMSECGLNARLFPVAAEMKWSKMITNLLANATSAILDMDPADIFAHPGLYRLEVEQLREALRVMDALRLRVVDLPATPVRALAFAIRSLPGTISRPILRNAVGGGRGGKMPSFHIDLHSGSGRVEVDFLNGAVVRYGAKAQVPTPVNRLLNETLMKLASGEVSLQAYAHQPKKLLQEL